MFEELNLEKAGTDFTELLLACRNAPDDESRRNRIAALRRAQNFIEQLVRRLAGDIDDQTTRTEEEMIAHVDQTIVERAGLKLAGRVSRIDFEASKLRCSRSLDLRLFGLLILKARYFPFAAVRLDGAEALCRGLDALHNALIARYPAAGSDASWWRERSAQVPVNSATRGQA